ncbi:cyclophilin-like fold protein [Pseudomonas sp. A6]|uniref:cyclophilin-like fold protein n=1 Tax=Pseudomonas sp. A6 TaxID=410021 RepID=UPI0040253199
MKILIRLAQTSYTATLFDGPAARDFAALLPLDLVLEDYAATEKVSDLPRKLTTTGEPKAYEPSAGDITYYAPWGNLAIFHRPFSRAAGLVLLGRLDADFNLLRQSGSLKARIEVLKE